MQIRLVDRDKIAPVMWKNAISRRYVEVIDLQLKTKYPEVVLKKIRL